MTALNTATTTCPGPLDPWSQAGIRRGGGYLQPLDRRGPAGEDGDDDGQPVDRLHGASLHLTNSDTSTPAAGRGLTGPVAAGGGLTAVQRYSGPTV